MTAGEALTRTSADRIGELPPGSEEEKAALQRFADFVADMSPETAREWAPKLYAEDAYFNDTLKEVIGAKAIEEYFVHSLAGADRVTAQILDVARSGNNHYVRWTMMIRFKSLADGRDTHSTGISHLRFNREGQIAFHQDHWDAAGGFFEYVPVVGRLIRYVKGRL